MSASGTNDRRCDGVNRRDTLRIGGLTALGLGLGELLTSRQATANLMAKDVRPVKAKSCILIWLDGGPSHLEMFDPKPEAASEVRGPLGTIATSIPGYRVGECLERVAKSMDDIAVLRSVTSTLGQHNFGTHYMLTGYKPNPAIEYPSFNTVADYVRNQKNVLPNNISIPTARVGGGNFSGHGYLPNHFAPFSIGSDPAKPDFKVNDLNFFQGLDVARLNRRDEFLKQLDNASRSLDAGATAPNDPIFEQAFNLIASEEAKKAFDLGAESQATRNRYGRKSIGQSCLLARRLVERGVPFVTVNNKGWDTHNNLYTRLKEGYAGAKSPVGLIPSLDLALSGLIQDLKERGLFDETLIAVMGEFGRTPKLNTSGGRDHWPRVFSVVLAGGGIRGGQVIGESNSTGESPANRPLSPADITRTIYTLMGINPTIELPTGQGRMIKICTPESQLIDELV